MSKLKRAFRKARGVSYTRVVFKNEGHYAGGTARFSATEGVGLSALLGVSGTGATETDALIPFDLIGNERVLLRYANMFEQFRIKYIRVKFQPVQSGPVAMTPFPTTINGVGVSLTSSGIYRMLVWHPNVMNQNIELATITTDMMLEDPRVHKYNVYRPFTIAWKPKIISGDSTMWLSRHGDATTYHDTYSSKSKPMPWTNVVATYSSTVNGNAYDTAPMRQPLSQPSVAVQEGVSGGFSTLMYPSMFWKLEAVFEFRKRRKVTDAFITSFQESEASVTSI